MSPSDSELLQRYVQARSEPAFADLVARYLDLVYSAALRQVRRPHLAQEVTQHVFIELARHASRLGTGQVLGAWLYTVTRRRAIDLVRRETRRQARERAAMDLSSEPEHPEPDWIRVAPLLDEAMQTLPAPERSAVLLRYFENKSLREVGGVLGVSDDAAQKRVHRALERLRAHFARRRLSLDAAGLAALLAGHAVQAAPAGLAAPIAASAVAGAAAGLTAFFPSLAMSAFSKTIIAASLALGLVLYEHREASRLHNELSELRSRQESADRAQAARLSALVAENARLRAVNASAPAPIEETDKTTIAAIDAWLERVRSLRAHLKNHPERAIPEMSLLSEEDWLNASKTPLSSESDFRRADARLRDWAIALFGQRAQAAMNKYAPPPNGGLPATAAELGPWFDPPLDPAMLARWTIVPSDDPRLVAGSLGRDRVFTQAELVDPEYDRRWFFTAGSYVVLEAVGSTDPAVKKALAAYAAANAGRAPEKISELLRYAEGREAYHAIFKMMNRQNSTHDGR